MGTLRITIELDTDACEGHWGDYASRISRQLHAAIESDTANAPAIWPHISGWAERLVSVRLPDRSSQAIGRIVVDRSETGWDQ